MLLQTCLRACQYTEQCLRLPRQCRALFAASTGLSNGSGQQQQQLLQQQVPYPQPSCVEAFQQSHPLMQSAAYRVTHSRQQLLPLLARQFTSTSCLAAEVPEGQKQQQRADILQEPDEQQQQQPEQQKPLGLPGGLIRQPLFWNNLSSSIRSRKPAIKYPARHQWRYCAEDYDPMETFEARPLPPYAPLRAHTKDYNKIFHETKPQFHRNSYRRLWRKNLAIADQRWRRAWEAKLAAERKKDALVKRLSERIIRERSWQVWQLEQVQQQQQQ